MGFAGKRLLFSPPLPLPAASISVALAPIFAQPKSEKRLQRAESPTETLATQANPTTLPLFEVYIINNITVELTNQDDK